MIQVIHVTLPAKNLRRVVSNSHKGWQDGAEIWVANDACVKTMNNLLKEFCPQKTFKVAVMNDPKVSKKEKSSG